MNLHWLTENTQKGRQCLSKQKLHQITHTLKAVPLPKAFKALDSGGKDLLVGMSVYLQNTQSIRLNENLTFETKKEAFGSPGKQSESWLSQS